MPDHIRLTIGESLRRAANSSQLQDKGKPLCPIRDRQCEYVSTRCPDGCIRYRRAAGKVTIRLVDKDSLGRPIERSADR